MKRKYAIKIISVLLIGIVLTALASSVNAEDCHRWYIKRRVGEAPVFPPTCAELDKHRVYYIDKRAAEKGEKIIYLTFDAGYENGNIEKILDTLKAENIPAAFFLLDNIIIKNTDLVIRMADEGHLVCNHTRNHRNLSHADSDEIKKNLSSLEDVYREKTGREMAKFFRFPEGAYSIDAIAALDNMGYRTVFWSFAYDDWDNRRQPDRDMAVQKILDGTHEGAIMLFHPTSDTNAEIFPTLIKRWREMGYGFGSLDNLG